ncbi:hypothetical protein B0H63DRAFT_395339 [Podospora didyma]|uniref:RRM domain-containing protein n=1 Tax=Podospora didyma TaxID=330526 RepID=A0AAE0NNY8_9PEZI|nr:hypothetical protein B0H63DRAFT_395339 [Podospora didyma]
MDSNEEPAGIFDTIVVGGYSDESRDGSDDSFDAYGEGDGKEQEKDLPESGNDDYAKTFDSPTNQDLSEADEAQPDFVSKASESMNSSSAPDPLTSESPAVPPSAPISSSSSSSSSAPSPSSDQAIANGPTLSQGLSSPSAVSENPAPESRSTGPIVSPSHGLAALASETLAETPALAPAVSSGSAIEDDASVDIQKLVDGITARAVVSALSAPSLPPNPATPNASQTVVSAALNVAASLPPKPSVSQLQQAHLPAIPQAHTFQPQALTALAPLVASMPITGSAAPHGTFQSTRAPGTASDAISSLPPPPPASFSAPPPQSAPNAHHISTATDGADGNARSVSVQQAWELFQADEKRYTSEAKWERFPDGSRIFIGSTTPPQTTLGIGNLSSERVSKREVFDVFHEFGRLAQISLKNAYGFVQYHTVNEGQAAMQKAQGIELGGRKIHLEFSRTQKKKDKEKEKEERDRSPERRNPRIVADRGNDRYDGRDQGRRRDEYRPPRSPSPRRNDSRGNRDGPYSREHPGAAFDRRRSQSPARYGDPYRRRSPSPPRRTPPDADHLDIPRRYGQDVPDVQLLLLRDVSRDFVSWVQQAFHERGLKTDAMFLNPRFPREALVQRQVLEGVHAIIDLDWMAQTYSKISIQVFIRSGSGDVRFELYQNVDPSIAAELVLREKSQSAARSAYPPTNFNSSYLPDAPPAGYPYQNPHVPAAQIQAIGQAPDLASMVGQLDNTALQALLSSLQTSQGTPAQQAMIPVSMPPAPPPPQVDINALLNSLRNAAPAPTPALPAPQHGTGHNYAPVPAYYPQSSNSMLPTTAAPNLPAGFPGYADTAQQVQTIIDQLKRATK